MKKICLMFLLFLIIGSADAGRKWGDGRMAYPIFGDVAASPLQISFWPLSLVPADTNSAGIYGLNLNLTTFLHFQHTVYGISCGLTQVSEHHYGLSVALYNGIWRNAGLSLGLINSYEQNYGVCVGGFNVTYGGTSTITGDQQGNRIVIEPHNPNGVQIGICNIAKEGVQIGLFNVMDKTIHSRKNHGFSIQFGLLNHDPDAFIPWMPVFNFSSPGKKVK